MHRAKGAPARDDSDRSLLCGEVSANHASGRGVSRVGVELQHHNDGAIARCTFPHAGQGRLRFKRDSGVMNQ
jgi:hypothetical protein